MKTPPRSCEDIIHTTIDFMSEVDETEKAESRAFKRVYRFLQMAYPPTSTNTKTKP